MNSGEEMMNLDSENLFDRLPDDVLLLILNKLQDARSLSLLMSACKRFCSLILQVDEVSLQIPRKKKAAARAHHPRWKKNLLQNKFIKTLIKPISKMINFKSKKDECSCNCNSYYAPNEILEPFQDIKSLHVAIPCYENGRKLNSKTGKKNFITFLKWEAEFGSQLQSCVILGAKIRSDNGENAGETERETGENNIPDEELKLRIVWTISCLIAASARHELIQEIVKKHNMIENVVISDESGQGRVRMNKEQIKELKKLEERSSNSLRMKMWYVEKLEVPSLGKAVEGATVVVVVGPAGGGDGGGVEELVAGAFGGGAEERMIGEAVGRVMAANRCYTLEISSF